MENYKIFLCAISCFWLAKIYGNECGISPSLERYSIYNPNKIISGEYSKVGDWPWIVLTVSFVPGNMQKTGICTGTIIDKEWILTAAHCAVGKLNFIKYGTVDTDKGQDMLVKEVFIYPHYTRIHDNDIALMKLQNPLEFNENVSAICLDKNVQTFEGEIYVGAGFGNVLKGILSNETLVDFEDPDAVEYEKDSHQFLKESPMANIGVCDYKFPKFNITHSNGTICIGGVNTGPLQGDSGGPLMAIRNGKWIQLGVTSRGVLLKVDPISGRSITFYTDVNYYYDWIQKVISGSDDFPVTQKAKENLTFFNFIPNQNKMFLIQFFIWITIVILFFLIVFIYQKKI